MKNYKIKGSSKTYETPFDLMASEDVLKPDATFQEFESEGGDISFYDFVKQANELLCKHCADKADKSEGWSNSDHAQNASSGNSARNASSGYSARNASSGDHAQNASSGDYAQNASSGNSARNASSGDYAQNASSGDYAWNASSGNYARNASSGYSARNASSGDHAQNASSGDYAQNASSGDHAQNASSGNYAQNVVTGKNSIDVSCGHRSIIKGVDGTWIALADYKKDKNGTYIPCMIKSGQIGIATDFKGNALKAHQFYMLIVNDFVPIDIVDGAYMIPLTTKKHGEHTIKSAYYEKDYREHGAKAKKVYAAEKDGICAHGETVKEAIADCQFKHLQSLDVSEHVKRIRAAGKMTANDYRLLTGACRLGTDRFLQEQGYTWAEEKAVAEVLKITAGQWGHERLKELLGND